jgi:hypothetical protein
MRVTLGHLPVGEWNTETGPAWGDQKEWWAHVPRLHRVLANGQDHLSYQLGEMRRLCGLEGEAHPHRVDPGPRWWAAFHERYPEEPVAQRDPPYDPFHGGTDSLHLARHINSPLERQKGSVLLFHSDPSSRRAVLIVEEMAGWYANLASAGSSLPDIGSPSWYVDVVCKPVGWLGTTDEAERPGCGTGVATELNPVRVRRSRYFAKVARIGK